ncbi:MAG: TerB family tellurite resistance protein [Sulfuritalea sp.]|nr:TerB family tellurite resistance protein [Sulfuritalea sp.]
MTLNQQRAILALCLHAAFADGVKDDREREEVKRIAESLSVSPKEASGECNLLLI